MNIILLPSISLGIIGLCLLIGGKTRARRGQEWFWYACGALLIIGGIAYYFKVKP